MKAIFQTEEFGRIECERFASQTPVATFGEAYFAKEDFLSPIDPDGEFEDLWGRRFKVLFPVRAHSSDYAVLQVQQWKTAGQTKCEQA